MVKRGVYRRFIENIQPEIFAEYSKKLQNFLDEIEAYILSILEENYEFDVLSEKNKTKIRELISVYIKQMLIRYPDEKMLSYISRFGKKVYKLGLSDVFIISVFSMIKSKMKEKGLLSSIIEEKIETDLLAVLKPLTYISIQIDKKIEKISKMENIIGSIWVLDKINEAKREYIKLKNKVMKDIFEGSKKINKMLPEKYKLSKILKTLALEENRNDTVFQILQIHDKFHEYINYYIENRDKLNIQQKYLIAKELENISLRILFLLNQLQIELSNQLSFFDFLTESYNKNIFPVIFQKEIKRAERYGQPLTISIIDIDNFKKINDTYGHLIGDEVLRELSKLIKRNIRYSDYLFRFGGEEFILLLPHTDIDGAILTLEKIRKKVEESVFTDKQIRLTISCGISKVKHLENPFLDLEEADRLLYISKSSGKNRCTFTREF